MQDLQMLLQEGSAILEHITFKGKGLEYFAEETFCRDPTAHHALGDRSSV